jgi:hypothetical protein
MIGTAAIIRNSTVEVTQSDNELKPSPTYIKQIIKIT